MHYDLKQDILIRINNLKPIQMAFTANIYQVIIVSPGDVPEERKIARDRVLEWNDVNSRSKKIFLYPVGWEHNSYPEMGDRPQAYINKQILKDSDLLIGIFWTKIGSPTGDAISGSVEEIERHLSEGKPAMLYFSHVSFALDTIDNDQYSKLKAFKKKCRKKGLVESYNTPEEFRSKLTKQLSLKINQNTSYFKNNDITETKETNEIDFKKPIIDNLKEEEKELLVEASLDPKGSIVKVTYKTGFKIQTNKKRLNSDFTQRTLALWENVFNNLKNKNLIEPKGKRNEKFALTLLGFEIADKISAQRKNSR